VRIPEDRLRRLIQGYLEEDVGAGDVTSEAILGDEEGTGVIRAEGEGVLAGLEEASLAFRLCGSRPRPAAADGQRIGPGTEVLEVVGRAADILRAERTALNLLMRMSGIATATRAAVDACRAVNPAVRVAATRKTAPGSRLLDKKAVALGGGWTHRWGLHDAVLIKENHLAFVGLEEAVRRALRTHREVEVEVTSLEAGLRAAAAGARRVMLDNFPPEEAGRTYDALKESHPEVEVEVSGNITPETVSRYAAKADILSMGCLTHSVTALPFSLDVRSGES
jgi:nicotinate-nucleotide pyrophosphorylase (carboxylating)